MMQKTLLADRWLGGGEWSYGQLEPTYPPLQT